MTVFVEQIERNQKSEWEEYINSREDTSYVDYFAWRDTIEKVYGHEHFWYIAKSNGKIKGTIALTLTRHPILGSYLATAPFGSRGGFYAWDSSTANALLRKAEELKDSLDVNYVVVRHLDGDNSPPQRWQQSPIYNSSRIPVKCDADTLLHQYLKSNARNQIKKSLKKGYTASFGSEDLLDDFWGIIIRSMKGHGTPYHSKYFLKTLLDSFGENAKIIVVYNKNKEPLGGAFLIYHNNILSPLHAGILRKKDVSYCGVFLYWSFIEAYCSRQTRWIDLGRSLINSPNEHFKKKFQPIQDKLAYWYYLSGTKSLPNLNQSNPKYDIPRKLWSRMPLRLQTHLGPWFIKGIL